MIRRLNKHSDLKDLIKSCPSGVIDDIYAIEYYIQGYNTVIQENFTKKETMLEVIIPSTDLETLPNGILMRRAYYKVPDASYPDGYYNLEFEDNMNVWIGENESEEPVIPEYVTEEELAETLEGYATQDWVENQGYLTSASMSGYATEQWVENELMTGGYLTEYTADNRYPTFSWIESAGYATESWVSEQGYITSASLSGYATESWVQNQGYITSSALSGYATESYVDQAIEDAISGSDIPLPENVVEYEDTTSGWMSVLSDYEDCDILKRPVDDEYTGGGVHEANTKNLVLGYCRVYDENSTEQDITLIEVGRNPSGTMTLYKHVISYGYEGDNNGERVIDYVTSDVLSDYVPRSYLSTTLSGYATKSYVSTAIATSLSGYATTSDVSTAIATSLSGYATEQYVDDAIAEATWGSDIPLPSNIVEYDEDHPLIVDFGYNVDVLKRSTFDHTSGGHLTDRITKGLVLAYEETYSNDVITDMDTIEIRDGLLASVHYDFDEVDGQPDYHESRSYYATTSDVTTAISTALSGYATTSDVSTAISTALSGYTTTSDVSTAISTALSGYATQQWVQNNYGTRNWTSNNFVAQSSVWTGTQAQWNLLSASEKASYTIALITQ